MNRKQCGVMLALSFLGGVVGSLFLNHLLLPEPVLASKSNKETKIVEAYEFKVVDEEGRLRASLGCKRTSPEFDAVSFAMFGKDKKGIVSASVINGNPGISLRQNGRRRAQLWVDLNGDLALRMQNKYGWDCAELKVSPTNEVSLTFYKPLTVDAPDPAFATSEEDIKNYFKAQPEEHANIRAVLGNIELKDMKTGEVTKRPINSLILFGEEGWRR